MLVSQPHIPAGMAAAAAAAAMAPGAAELLRTGGGGRRGKCLADTGASIRDGVSARAGCTDRNLPNMSYPRRSSSPFADGAADTTRVGPWMKL